MTRPIQPIYLFSDSRPLFWREKNELLLSRVRHRLGVASPSAAYVGASNGDDPQFYSIFTAAMAGIGVTDCRMILSSYSRNDQLFLDRADIILLAGGDLERGWDVIERVGLKEELIRRYHCGSALLGISAGAIQIGQYGFRQDADKCISLFETLKLAPLVVDVHEEKSGWERLKTLIKFLAPGVKGIGIPSGGGIIYHPENTVEALRLPACEFSIRDKKLVRTFLFPRDKRNPQQESKTFHVID